MARLQQTGIVLVIFIFISTETFSQGNLSIGGGVGFATPLYSFSEDDKAAAFSQKISYGFFITALSQYVFDDRFGLETGVSIKVLNYSIKSHDLPHKSR